MRQTLLLGLVALLAGCTSGTTAVTPTPAPTSSVTTPAARSLLVAVKRETRNGIWLYRIGPDRRAALVWTVTAAPQGAFPRALTLSAGPTPDRVP